MPVSAGIQAGAQMATALVNQAFAEHNRERNYYWNEKAADSADKRQRKQYKDMYSPQAQIQQYQAAGLSPSMMMSGGQSAVGGTPAGAMGSLNGPYPSIPSAINLADIKLKEAQKENLETETEGKAIDNAIKRLDLGIRNETYFSDIAEKRLLQTFIHDAEDPNKKTSIVEYALSSKNYKDFTDKLNDVNLDETTKQFIHTERGQSILRSIYESSQKTETDVQKMLGDRGYSLIMQQIVEKLNENGFAKLSAQAQVNDLKRIVESSELQAEQKKVVNDLFDKIENENIRSIAIILYTIADRYLGSINANVNANNSTINK